MSLRVVLAGATGWAGSALARAVHAADDLELVGAVARSSAGRPLGESLGLTDLALTVSASAADALRTPCDVFVEYTRPEVAKGNVLAALAAGAHVVVGTSGLTDDDYAEIDGEARARGRGVLAAGNFALTAVLLAKLAELAARYVPHWEIVDYAHAGKADVPSGTVRELAQRLGRVREPRTEIPVDQVQGPPEARGAELGGARVHSLRLPGYVLGAEVHFGMPDQRLVLRQEAGASPEPYVEGALLAIRKVGGLVGLHRGLDAVMDL